MSAAVSQPLMAAEAITCYYGSKRAVAGVSMEIRAGEVLALIGPSGCGKTTFLRSLNRMLDLVPGARAEGTVRLGGVDVRGGEVTPETLRRRVGYVFQLPNPFPLSIYDNVALAMLEHRLARRREDCRSRVERALVRMGLYEEVRDRLDQPALALSGGQQQRLCLARLLAIEPEVVLLDEPCSALDPASTERIEHELTELKRDVGVVIVTHNLAQARRIADRVGFFLNGELVEIGSAAQVFEAPADTRTRDYVAGRFG
jgi:phosphate transport system ATP-binding protein